MNNNKTNKYQKLTTTSYDTFCIANTMLCNNVKPSMNTKIVMVEDKAQNTFFNKYINKKNTLKIAGCRNFIEKALQNEKSPKELIGIVDSDYREEHNRDIKKELGDRILILSCHSVETLIVRYFGSEINAYLHDRFGIDRKYDVVDISIRLSYFPGKIRERFDKTTEIKIKLLFCDDNPPKYYSWEKYCRYLNKDRIVENNIIGDNGVGLFNMHNFGEDFKKMINNIDPKKLDEHGKANRCNEYDKIEDHYGGASDNDKYQICCGHDIEYFMICVLKCLSKNTKVPNWNIMIDFLKKSELNNSLFLASAEYAWMKTNGLV